MRGRRAWSALFLVTAASCTQGGAGGPCPPPGSCPTGTAKMTALYGSPVTYAIANVEHASTTVGVGGDCLLTTQDFSTRNLDEGAVVPASSFDSLPVTFDLACSGDGGTITISAKLDPRDFPIGITTVTGAQAGLVGHVVFSDPMQGGAQASCVFAIDDLPLSVMVEEATGGRAAFPEAVTSDFHRTFHVAFDTRNGTRTNRTYDVGKNGCDSTFYVVGAARFEQKAADYVLDPEASCACPG